MGFAKTIISKPRATAADGGDRAIAGDGAHISARL